MIKELYNEAPRVVIAAIHEVDSRVCKNKQLILDALAGVRENGVQIRNIQTNILSTGNVLEDISRNISQKSTGNINGGMQAAINENSTSVQAIENRADEELMQYFSEVLKLLEKFSQNHPHANDMDKKIFVNDETSPGFKRRAINAFKAASEQALEEFLDNPYFNVGKALIKGWAQQERPG